VCRGRYLCKAPFNNGDISCMSVGEEHYSMCGAAVRHLKEKWKNDA
jgi:hypothetical protein